VSHIVTTVYLIRHAHAEWQPDEARPLSPRGLSSAATLAERLGARPIIAVYSSPARRALETVLPLAQRLGLTPIVMSDLREREITVPPGLTFDEAVAKAWAEPATALPDSESNLTAQARGLTELRTILAGHPDREVVVSTHGNLLALMLNGLDSKFGYDFWRQQTFPDVYEAAFETGVLVGVRRIWEAA
jgi:2,3-bisphosphoglycerate-dependent phosphoglycerate mutase